MHPRQFAFALLGAIVGGLIGYLGAVALRVNPIGGAVVIGVVGIAVGIGVGRYLGRMARLREAGRAIPEIDIHAGHSGELRP